MHRPPETNDPQDACSRPTIRPHRRQWLIARTDSVAGLPDHFRVEALDDGLFLHHDPDLRIDASVPGVLTLGLLVGDAAATPAHLRHHLSGRFVTIAESRLHLDATGSMAVFYARDPAAVVCSSSVALIVQVAGVATLARELRWRGRSMNWDPSPSCRALRFSRLFFDQALDLKSGRPEQLPRPPLSIAGDPAERLAEYLARFMTALATLSRPIYLPLTAGNDSRTLLAAALAQKLDFTAYTDLRGGRSVVDDHVAKRLARRYGFRHISNWPGARDEAGSSAYAAHTAGCEGDSGSEQVLNSLYRMFPPGAITLSGGVFEIGRLFYLKRLGAISFDDPAEAALATASAFNSTDAPVVEALEQWIRYRQQHPVAGMNMIELFYLDQRLGGWASANRQAEDSTGLTRLTPMNSWEAISILLSVPPDQRVRATVQADAMERLLPGIGSAEPLNPRFPRDLPARFHFWARSAFRRRT